MLAAVVVAACLAAVAAGLVAWIVLRAPAHVDRHMRTLLVEYKEWKDRDYVYKRTLGGVAAKLTELHDADGDNLDKLRLDRVRVSAELERLVIRNEFLGRADDPAESRLQSQIEELEQRIDDHPDRERELEETRNRLVARIEDIQRAEAEGLIPS